MQSTTTPEQARTRLDALKRERSLERHDQAAKMRAMGRALAPACAAMDSVLHAVLAQPEAENLMSSMIERSLGTQAPVLHAADIHGEAWLCTPEMAMRHPTTRTGVPFGFVIAIRRQEDGLFGASLRMFEARKARDGGRLIEPVAGGVNIVDQEAVTLADGIGEALLRFVAANMLGTKDVRSESWPASLVSQSNIRGSEANTKRSLGDLAGLVPLYDDVLADKALPSLLGGALVMLRSQGWDGEPALPEEMVILMDATHNMPSFMGRRLHQLNHRVLLETSVLPVLSKAREGSSMLRRVADSWLNAVREVYGLNVEKRLREASGVGEASLSH